MKAQEFVSEKKWTKKYKSSINCSHPRGFSQKAHCAGRNKSNESVETQAVCPDCGLCETHGTAATALQEACWKGYHREGNKKMFGKTYPNCVKNKKKTKEAVTPTPVLTTESSCPRTRASTCECSSVGQIMESNQVVTAMCVLEHGDQVQGTILFRQQPGSPTFVVGEITGLKPGAHGFHIHEFGDLSNGCESAGKHYDPDGVDHSNIKLGHVGDLGNIVADQQGRAAFSIVASRVDLTGDRSVVGRAVVVHEDPDDLGQGGDAESLVTGNAGKRLACGVITLKQTVTENINSIQQGVAEGARVARKAGQPANSKKHSDLYTDENPRGTITGLKFATPADARASVSKIRNSGRSHAHKIQAAVAMEQRARAAGKAQEAAVYRRYINANKKTDETIDLEEDLKDWFGTGKGGGAGGGGWDRYNAKGERIGKCGDRKASEGKPKCLSKSRAASLRASGGKGAIASAVRRKRAKDKNPERSGAARNVASRAKKS